VSNVISEVRVKLVDPDPNPDTSQNDKLLAFCSITLDNAFVIRDLKIIGSSKGPFVAMPSRKLADKCSRCGSKNHLRARFCNECGGKLNPDRADRDVRGRCKLHADIAHPINAKARSLMQDAVLTAYRQELERCRSEGYVATYYEDDHD
jgi:stage V sporulation protein G